MVWLYKGAYSCSYELGKGEPTLQFLGFPIKMLRLLKNKEVKPICVFDGFHLKAKQGAENERLQDKLKNRIMAEDADEKGDIDLARKHYARSLVLRGRMIDLFMDILKEIEVEFLVAPYEADAQMAYMVKEGIADFAISEDSDLIAYGCPKMLMKLDFFGAAKAYSLEDFKSTKAHDTEKSFRQLQALSKEEFVYACIMAGCEYLGNIERIGLKVALKHFEREKSFKKVMEFLRANKTTKDKVPAGYELLAERVSKLFVYQTVYDPRAISLTQLSSIADTSELDMEYLGQHDHILPILPEFVAGDLMKSTLEKRKTYKGQSVIDMSKIRMDYFRNELSDRSFVCLDWSFFTAEDAKPGEDRGKRSPDDMPAGGDGQNPVAVDYTKLSKAMT